MTRQRLYINVDHIATLRQARRASFPDPVEGALLCERAGADGITAHLREDRRHIQDDDIERLATSVGTVLNLEMACTEEMVRIAERLRPHQVTLVPERREEVTTEGGLDVRHDRARLADGLARLNAAGIRTSLFIDPAPAAPSVPAAASVAESVLQDHPEPKPAKPAIAPEAASVVPEAPAPKTPSLEASPPETSSPEIPSPGLQPGSGSPASPDKPQH